MVQTDSKFLNYIFWLQSKAARRIALNAWRQQALASRGRAESSHYISKLRRREQLSCHFCNWRRGCEDTPVAPKCIEVPTNELAGPTGADDECSFSISSETRSIDVGQDSQLDKLASLDTSHLSAIEAYSKVMADVFCEGRLVDAGTNEGRVLGGAVSRLVLRSRGCAIRSIVNSHKHSLVYRIWCWWRAVIQRSAIAVERGMRRRQFSLISYIFQLFYEYYKRKVTLRRQIGAMETQLQFLCLRGTFFKWWQVLPRNEVHECDWDCGFFGTRDQVLQHEAACEAMHAATAWKAQTSMSMRSAIKRQAGNETQFSSRAPRSPADEHSEIQMELEFSKFDNESTMLTLYEGESEQHQVDQSSRSDMINASFFVSPPQAALAIKMLLVKIAVHDEKLAGKVAKDLTESPLEQPLKEGLDAFVSALAWIKAREVRAESTDREASASEVFADTVLRSLADMSGEPFTHGVAKDRARASDSEKIRHSDAKHDDYRERVLATCLCDWVGDQPNKLSFKKGDKVAVILTTASGWAYGCLTGTTYRKGWFPATFVTTPKVTALTLPLDSDVTTNEVEMMKQQREMQKYLRSLTGFISHEMHREGRLTKEEFDVQCMPVALVVTFDADFSIMYDANVSMLFDSQVRRDVAEALGVQNSCVSVLYYRDNGIVVGLALRRDVQSSRTGMQLAQTLIQHVNSRQGSFSLTTTGGLAVAAALQGPLAESVVTSLESNRHPWSFNHTSSKLQAYLRRLIEDKTSRCKSALRVHLLTASFEGWLSCADARLTRRRRIWNVIDRWRNGSLFVVFRQWSIGIRTAKRGRHVLDKALLRWRRGMLVRGFFSWRDAACQMKRTKNTAARILGRIANRELATAFDSFWHHVRGLSAMRQSALNVIMKLKHGSLARAFESWLQVWCQAKNAVQRRAISVQAWMHLGEHRAFQMWQEYADMHKKMRGTAYQVVARLSSRSLALAFDAWMDSLETSRAVRATARRVLIRMQNRSLSAAWMRWEDLSKREKSQRNKKVKIIARIMNLLLSKTFHSWRNKVKNLCRQRRILHKFVNQWHMRNSSRAFATWVDRIRATKKFRIKSCMVVKRWMNRTLGSALSTWVLNIRRDRFLRDKARASIARWAKQELWQTYSAWTDHVRRTKRRSTKGLECLRRWRNSTQSTYFITWALRTQQKFEIRDMILRSGFKCNEDRILTAFQSWSNVVQVARKSALRSLNTDLSAHPTALSVSMDLEFDSTFASSNERSSFEKQLQTDICKALDIEIERVCVLCHQKGSIVSEIVLGSPKGVTTHDSAELAVALADLVGKPGGALFRTPLGKHMTRATVHGPICEEAVAALRRAKEAEESRAEFAIGEFAYRMLLPLLTHGRECQDVLEEATCKLQAQVLKVQEDQQAKLRKIIFRMRHAKMATALHSWQETVEMKKRARDQTLRSLQRWQGNSLRMALDAWDSAMGQAAQLRDTAERVLKRWTNSALASAFDHWSQLFYRALEARQQKLRKAVGRWNHLHITLVSAFDFWRRWVVFKMSLMCTARTVMIWWLNLMLTSAWRSWTNLFKRGRVLRRSLERMKNACRYKAYATWEYNAKELSRQRGVLERMALRMRNATAYKAYATWADHVKELRRQRGVLERMALRMRNATAYKAYATWADNVKELRRQRGVLERVALRMRNATAYRAHATWADSVKELRRQRGVLERMALRMQNATAYKAYSTWADHVKELRRQRGVLERMALRMRNATAYKAYATWRESVQAKQGLARAAAKVVSRWAHIAIAVPFTTWRALCDEQRRLKGAAKRVVSRWGQLTIAVPFASWQARSQEQKRLWIAASRVVKRWQRTTIASSWQSWVDGAYLQAQKRGSGFKVVGRWANHTVSRIFSTWKLVTAESLRVQRLKTRVILRMRSAFLFRVLLGWMQAVREQVRLRKGLTKFLLTWSRREISTAFETWWSKKTEFSRQRHVLERTAVRMKQASMFKGFSTWYATTRSIQRQRCTMERIIYRMKNAAVFSALMTWRAHVLERVRLRSGLTRILHMWVHRATCKYFTTWDANVRELHNQRDVLERMALRMRNATAYKAYATWADNLRELHHQRGVLERVALRMRNATAYKAYATWADNMKELRRQRGVLERMALRMRNATAYRAYATWADNVKELRRHRGVLGRIALRMTNAGMYRAWGSWQSNASELRRQRGVLERMAMRMMNVLTGKCLVAWQCQWSENKRLRRAATR